MKTVCMIVQNSMVKGGIAAVVNGYRGSKLEKDYNIIYVESYKDGGKIIKLLKAILGYIHFVKVLAFHRPDLVHIHSSFGPSFYRKMPYIYISFWAKIPIINHIHGADFDNFYLNAGEWKKKLIRIVYGKCNMLIALSDEWKEKLSQIVPSCKITIIENYSILHEDAFHCRIDRSCNNQILFLGELGKRKGGYDIPAIIQRVVKVIPNAKFILCGTGSQADEAKMRKLIHENGVDGNVEFPGWVRNEKKNEVLLESDVFLLPSYNEGMPMSILDAMGYGLPIVSTDVGGIPKIVHDGENGFCRKPGDIKGMAECIIDLLTNDKKRKAAAKASLDIIKAGYSLEKHIREIEKVYEEEMK